MTILALIPARGGSKGIPGKNVRDFMGKPLIAWTIDSALRAKGLGKVVVSTDDPAIAQLSKELGAEVPFLRPHHLARDDSPSMDTVAHAIRQLPGFDWILLLQPTSPLRTEGDIEALIDLVSTEGAPSGVSITACREHHEWALEFTSNNRIAQAHSGRMPSRRQDLQVRYVPNGALYLARTDWLVEHARFVDEGTVGYVMPLDRSVDIDTPLDWIIAECMFRHQREQSA